MVEDSSLMVVDSIPNKAHANENLIEIPHGHSPKVPAKPSPRVGNMTLSRQSSADHGPGWRNVEPLIVARPDVLPVPLTPESAYKHQRVKGQKSKHSISEVEGHGLHLHDQNARHDTKATGEHSSRSKQISRMRSNSSNFNQKVLDDIEEQQRRLLSDMLDVQTPAPQEEVMPDDSDFNEQKLKDIEAEQAKLMAEMMGDLKPAHTQENAFNNIAYEEKEDSDFDEAKLKAIEAEQAKLMQEMMNGFESPQPTPHINEEMTPEQRLAQIEEEQARLLAEMMGEVQQGVNPAIGSNNIRESLKSVKVSPAKTTRNLPESATSSIHSKWNQYAKIFDEDQHPESRMGQKKTSMAPQTIKESAEDITPRSKFMNQDSSMRGSKSAFKNKPGNVHEEMLSEDSSEEPEKKPFKLLKVQRSSDHLGKSNGSSIGFSTPFLGPGGSHANPITGHRKSMQKETSHDGNSRVLPSQPVIAEEAHSNLEHPKAKLRIRPKIAYPVHSEEKNKPVPSYHLAPAANPINHQNGHSREHTTAVSIEDRKPSSSGDIAGRGASKSIGVLPNDDNVNTKNGFTLKLQAQKVDMKGKPYSISNSSEDEHRIGTQVPGRAKKSSAGNPKGIPRVLH